MSWQRLEANRILAMWRGGLGAEDGITPDLITWCLFLTGDLGHA